jgi:hypothetical protein
VGQPRRLLEHPILSNQADITRQDDGAGGSALDASETSPGVDLQPASKQPKRTEQPRKKRKFDEQLGRPQPQTSPTQKVEEVAQEGRGLGEDVLDSCLDEDLGALLPLETDPLVETTSTPMNIWLQEIGEIQPRKLVVPDASEQEASIASILSELESEPCEPSSQLVRETEQAISTLLKRIPDANQL